MKREDIISIIEENLQAYHPISMNDFTEVSSNILKDLEKAGMLPPTFCVSKVIEENDYCPVDGIVKIKKTVHNFYNKGEE